MSRVGIPFRSRWPADITHLVSTLCGVESYYRVYNLEYDKTQRTHILHDGS